MLGQFMRRMSCGEVTTDLAELVGNGFSIENVETAKAQALAHDPCVTCGTICRTLDQREEWAHDASFSACCSEKCMDAYVKVRILVGEVLHNRRSTPYSVAVLSFGRGEHPYPGQEWVCFVRPRNRYV